MNLTTELLRIETRKRIEEFWTFPWFQNVGQPKTDDVRAAECWDHAFCYCGANAWTSLQVMLNYQLGVSVERAHDPRLENWNEIIAAIHLAVGPLLKKHIAPIALRHRFSKPFETAVFWDLMEISLETEFQDICEPIFFINRVLPWYQRGHFPCGWDGPPFDETWHGIIPPGHLIVF